MGKPTGFLELARSLPKKRDRHERLHDWHELQLPQAPAQTREQAARCMDCGVPFCHQGCPLGNQIPDFNELVYRDRWQDAFRNLASTNNFPEFTGRLCPAPCEASCVLAINTGPVTIEQVEKELVERAFVEGWIAPRPPARRTGRHVAVVGSGPAGLAAAAQLNEAGHRVTVYERDGEIGGLLRYGIPDFKLEKWVIDRRLRVLQAEGIAFRPGCDVGRAPGWDELKKTHDAVVLAIGSRRSRELEVPGRELGGIALAMDYLEAQNRAVATRTTSTLDARGKRVVVLGGGDTGSDCLGTALRQGAGEVTQLELLPAPPPARAAGNPWPQWPLVLRTSSSQEEGGARTFGALTRRLRGGEGKLEALETVDVRLEGGRLLEVAGTEKLVPCDLLVLALGFVGPDASSLEAQLGLKLDGRGNVATDAGYATNVPGVYCAGDARRGASLIVWAIAEGRETARSVDRWLAGETHLPARGADQPW